MNNNIKKGVRKDKRQCNAKLVKQTIENNKKILKILKSKMSICLLKTSMSHFTPQQNGNQKNRVNLSGMWVLKKSQKLKYQK